MIATKDAHTLAETLYEASNTTHVPWSRRGRLVQDAWLGAATRQLASTPPPLPDLSSTGDKVAEIPTETTTATGR
ncbi:hypothetical protein [Nitrospirillum iridis]|uniref:Uncharacterized protein n=1 Tax=Nitrospirillum iridis TaxID=765888 RepID=A0A7X0AVA0_9PROT|nr:hypothetical protein [Nitrospirillum iridis]MBB6250774.1 hypothetical protein [Nitrospirillum iridis]